jgi:hypothetical protein
LTVPAEAVRVNVEQEPSIVNVQVPAQRERRVVKHIQYDENGRPARIDEREERSILDHTEGK